MAIIKYKNHVSIKAIKNRMAELNNNNTFSFDFICHEEIIKEIDKLFNKKASENTDLLEKIIKVNKDLILYCLHHNFNNSVSCFIFPTTIKYAHVKPIHKKDDETDKENYRPISIFPNLSKIYERIMYNQISPSFNTVF